MPCSRQPASVCANTRAVSSHGSPATTVVPSLESVLACARRQVASSRDPSGRAAAPSRKPLASSTSSCAEAMGDASVRTMGVASASVRAEG